MLLFWSNNNTRLAVTASFGPSTSYYGEHNMSDWKNFEIVSSF